MLDPSMQVFFLTDRCDNACSFCICKRHLREGIADSPSNIRKKIQAIQEGGIVDIYGGEPTLSGFFMEILRQAKKKHCFINIASNARSFARRRFFEEFLEETGDYRDRIFVRSSLHGHTAAIHERHTARANSFTEAIDGFRTLKQCGYRLSVNTVITRHNCTNLRPIHSLIRGYQVDVFKFSFMRHTRQNIHLAVSLEDLRAQLPDVLEQVATSKMTMDLDTIPYCVAPAQLAYYVKEEHKIIENDKRVVKPEKCSTCSMVGMCPGVDREYFELFGGDELEPISREHMDKFQAAVSETP